ncbi:MAG: SRPBCC family protein [Acidimicrobiia bacterium]
MSTEQQPKHVAVSADIAADPEAVWRLISDLSRMGEWSPECTGVSWVGSPPGREGPSVGAVFKGKNRSGFRRWSTKGTIVAADPNRRIAWDTAALGLPGARWGYSIEPTDGGCRVTESWEDKRGGLLTFLGPLATGVKDRAAHNEAGMRATLERLKAAAEAQAR